MSTVAQRSPGEGEQASELAGGVERRLDELYREPPEEFVKRRDALARELRAEGDGGAAAAVKKLRRPSAAAWVINRVSADEPQRTRELVQASEDLAEAQRRVLAGAASGDELRAAAAQERERIEELVADARRVVAGHGGNVAKVVERVAETLRAAGTDADLRGRVLRGRVEREQSAATVGIPGGVAVKRGKGARAKPEPNRAALERARRELARLRGQLADAESRRDRHQHAVAEAEVDLRKARETLTESKRTVRELERRVRSAERDAGGG